MIAWLNGQILDKTEPGKLVLEVNGVGYDVETSLNTFFRIESSNLGLHIHTIVREDAFLLYGFLDKEERSLFRALIKVNGVGPKLAMVILSSIKPEEFIHCIAQNNANLLTKIPGIGKKTADRLLIELSDNIKQFTSKDLCLNEQKMTLMQIQTEAISALETLGYKPQEAFKVIHKIGNGHKTCEQLIREALQILSS